MARVTLTWLDILICLATGVAVSAYYILHMQSIEVAGVTILFVKYGVFIAAVYVTLELLSAVVGEGGNMTLFWISYLASWFVAIATTFAVGYTYLGMQQNYDAVVTLMAVPYAKELLWFLLVFSWFSALVLQSHKHRSAWAHATVARTVLPPPPVPPTVPAAIAPPVPGSAASIVLITLFLFVLGVIAFKLMFGGIRINTFGNLGTYSIASGDGCVPRYVGRDGSVARYEIDADCK